MLIWLFKKKSSRTTNIFNYCLHHYGRLDKVRSDVRIMKSNKFLLLSIWKLLIRLLAVTMKSLESKDLYSTLYHEFNHKQTPNLSLTSCDTQTNLARDVALYLQVTVVWHLAVLVLSVCVKYNKWTTWLTAVFSTYWRLFPESVIMATGHCSATLCSSGLQAFVLTAGPLIRSETRLMLSKQLRNTLCSTVSIETWL